MKKVVTTLTVLSFVLGLALSGQAQSTAPKESKPAVQTQASATGSQVTPAPGSQATQAKEGKAQDVGTVQAKEEDQAKNQEQGKNPGKKLEKKQSVKNPGTSTTETKSNTKKEEKQDKTK
uniref:Uncharacterized protein n=1 Tax=Desulfobacca acetoxidans TaxID=60893 RepID=A0A7C5EM95_9BACT